MARRRNQRRKPKKIKLYHATHKSSIDKMLKSGKVRGYFTRKFTGDNSASYYARIRRAETGKQTIILEVSATRGQLRQGYRGGYDPNAFEPRLRLSGERYLDADQIKAIYEFDVNRGWVRKPIKGKQKRSRRR